MLLEFWKQAVEDKKAFGTLGTDLYKAFDCLNHELLIAKLHACSLDLSALKLLQDYLSDCKQITKTDFK